MVFLMKKEMLKDQVPKDNLRTEPRSGHHIISSPYCASIDVIIIKFHSGEIGRKVFRIEASYTFHGFFRSTHLANTGVLWSIIVNRWRPVLYLRYRQICLLLLSSEIAHTFACEQGTNDRRSRRHNMCSPLFQECKVSELRRPP